MDGLKPSRACAQALDVLSAGDGQGNDLGDLHEQEFRVERTTQVEGAIQRPNHRLLDLCSAEAFRRRDESVDVKRFRMLPPQFEMNVEYRGPLCWLVP